ncbi:CoA transferase [Temperatibacter marinus]|uniref:CoA transferase n=1 Tax=Temperatibacter marinus TaxID=1456591 RepID=A0AA52EJ50_9PROT|nr:CoA transferase [Temperatibacter marinus]WND03477.1 CoA transferase [Temperatibacter marinus]
MSTQEAFGALKGLRVLELGQLIAGPFCGQLLADHGAEVIKIEAPDRPDPMREWGQGIPLWWSVCARNKKCITLNLREKAGQDILKEMVKHTDFLLENFRAGTMEKWGLSYEELKKINPKLIMIRVSGYGQTGPYSKRAGYGSIGEAMGGMRNLAGDPANPPSRVGISIGDSLAATYACLGALMALRHRDVTGEGQIVDSAIYEAVLANMESVIPEYVIAGHTRERTGSVLPSVAPSNAYPTLDGDILIGANQDSVYKRLCEAMGRPELVDDPRFVDHVSRGKNLEVIDEIIADWTRPQKAQDVLDLMEKFGVPSGKIFKAPDMLDDPHFEARDAIIEVDHPVHDKVPMQNVFPKLSETPGEVKWAGPVELGQHNSEVYGSILGYDAVKLKALKEAGTV